MSHWEVGLKSKIMNRDKCDRVGKVVTTINMTRRFPKSFGLISFTYPSGREPRESIWKGKVHWKKEIWKVIVQRFHRAHSTQTSQTYYSHLSYLATVQGFLLVWEATFAAHCLLATMCHTIQPNSCQSQLGLKQKKSFPTRKLISAVLCSCFIEKMLPSSDKTAAPTLLSLVAARLDSCFTHFFCFFCVFFKGSL